MNLDSDLSLVPKTAGTFQSFDGTEIYYEVRGSGPPLILNYGIGCLMNHWRPQVRHFAKDYRVITWDYRAHHQSGRPDNLKNLTLDALVHDLERLMAHLKISRASLWGHSFGAQVLARFYDLHPDRVANLIFVNGFVENPLLGMFGSQDLTEKVFRFLKTSYARSPETVGLVWRASVQSPIAMYLSALAGGFNLKLTAIKDIEIYARGIASMDIDAFLTLFEAMTQYDGRSVLNKIQVPTLIVAGKQDSVTPIKHQREMHRRIKNSELCEVPYGSHCTQLDMPDLVDLKIERFLECQGFCK